MKDRVMLPAATEVEIAVPRAVLNEFAGVRYGLNGQPIYTPLTPGEQYNRPGILRFGGHHLGEWVVTAVTVIARTDPAEGGTYVAHLQRVSPPPEREPLDDDFALWLRARRDACPYNTAARRVLDATLDDYREHRATGTPLDREIERD